MPGDNEIDGPFLAGLKSQFLPYRTGVLAFLGFRFCDHRIALIGQDGQDHRAMIASCAQVFFRGFEASAV